MYKSRIVRFVECLILTFLRLDYRDATLITLYYVVLGISISKISSTGLLYHIKICY